MNRDISFEDFVDFLSYSVAAHMLIIIHFLDGYALEEIQISTAETRISILPYQTLFVIGGWRHPALPNVPQTYPRTMIPVLRKLLTKPESEREGGWARAIFVA